VLGVTNVLRFSSPNQPDLTAEILEDDAGFIEILSLTSFNTRLYNAYAAIIVCSGPVVQKRFLVALLPKGNRCVPDLCSDLGLSCRLQHLRKYTFKQLVHTRNVMSNI
jgi:hypothetical protein